MTSTTTRSRTGSPQGVRRGWLLGARVVMALSGVQLLAGSVYFTFFAAPEVGGVVTPFDWFVAVWAMAAAVALLATALLPMPSPARRLQVARWVVGAHLVWALVKVLAYDEMPVSVVVVLVDIGILGLLWQAGRADQVRQPGQGQP